jgi:prepilin peptidase CpaA
MMVLPTLMILAAASDVTSYRIPNWLTALTALLFFPMALLTGMPLAEFGYHVLGGVILFVAGYALFSLGLFGGGDAKLMAAAGLWFGTSQTVSFLFMTVLAGGVLTVVVVLWSYLSLWSEMEGKFWSSQMNKLKPKVPYGFAIAAGAILAYPQTWWVKDLV